MTRASADPVLILDTALGACTAVAANAGRILAARHEVMARGHQERLGVLVREVMIEAGLEYAELSAVGVTVGPGSFTGLRVGLAFAQGLGLALDRPVLGVSTLAALAEEAGAGPAAGVIDARRGQVYWQAFRDGTPLAPPAALEIEAAQEAARALGPGAALVGSGAALIADAAPGARVVDLAGPSPRALTALMTRLMAQGASAPPAPLYLRGADAKLPGGRDPA